MKRGLTVFKLRLFCKGVPVSKPMNYMSYMPCLNVCYLSVVCCLLSCSSAPKLQRIQLEWAVASASSSGTDASERRLQDLAVSLRGKTFGDLIFNEETSAVWVVPGLDILELKLAASEERFSEAEFDARLNRLKDVHENFLVFSVDLRWPFYSGWTQAELLGYLEKNLVVELDTGGKQFRHPVRRIFRVKERFQREGPPLGRLGSAPVEVSVPVRVYFKREDEGGIVIAPLTHQIAIRLSLLTSPPFSIDFFDDKFFHGFLWTIVE